MRLAAKTATYACMHLTVAIAVTYALTRDWHVALAVGVLEPMVQTVFFNIHERLWARVDAKKNQALVSKDPPASSSEPAFA